MFFKDRGARRTLYCGNFESFSRDENAEASMKKDKFEDDFPPAHKFFTSFAAKPVLMTFGLRIFIPLMTRNTLLRKQSRFSPHVSSPSESI